VTRMIVARVTRLMTTVMNLLMSDEMGVSWRCLFLA
jgi:hypothetical protein